MARRKVNKSEKIKEALAQHGDKGPSEIAELLAGQGIKVSATFVSNIKSKMKGEGNSVAKKRKGAAKTGTADPATLITDVRELANRAGGLDRLGAIVEALK